MISVSINSTTNLYLVERRVVGVVGDFVGRRFADVKSPGHVAELLHSAETVVA